MAEDSETLLRRRVQAGGLGIAQGIRAAHTFRKGTSMELIERREMRLQAPINSLLNAALCVLVWPGRGTHRRVDHRVAVCN
jgi:hypothetical protein